MDVPGKDGHDHAATGQDRPMRYVELRRVVAGLPDGGRALVVGHSPTNETAVLGLAGRVVPRWARAKGFC